MKQQNLGSKNSSFLSRLHAVLTVPPLKEM